jgi:hypothetical protein
MGSHTQDMTPAEPEFTRPILIGMTLGVIVFLIVVTGMGLATGFDGRDSFGLAAFCALWGGIGFGAMFGAVYAISRPDPTLVSSDVRREHERQLPHAA